MVVVWRQQMVENVHDYHHDKHSLPMVGLLFMVFIDEWLRTSTSWLPNVNGFFYSQ
jgi:hypothetical protein